jgi:hypothetical protein
MGRAKVLTAAVFGFVALIGISETAFAHCDGLDGPVVKAAQKALGTGNVNHVLIWTPAKDAREVRQAFQDALAVRKLNAQAKELADRYFFETVVRLHRAGEGEPYTGLKPAGRDLGPAIPAVDNAIATGSAAALSKLLAETLQHGLQSAFEKIVSKSKFSVDDVVAGREYVAEYVRFVHYIEQVYGTASVSEHSGHEGHEAHEHP